MKKFEKVVKIGYHSNSNYEWNTERGFKESLSIALGKKASLGIRGSGKAGKIQAQFMHWVQLMQVNVSENTIPLAYEMSSGRQK